MGERVSANGALILRYSYYVLGIIEYTSDATCGEFKNALFSTFYSTNDQLAVFLLSADGKSM